jgi:hypothetical protein
LQEFTAVKWWELNLGSKAFEALKPLESFSLPRKIQRALAVAIHEVM